MHILLIEDNAGDVLLTTEALTESGIENRLTVIPDGDKAIDFFESPLAKTDTPHLVLLDINLPKKDGHEVLHYLKNKEEYRKIPVIMLTTSSRDKDILMAFENSATSYITKPVIVEDLVHAIRNVSDLAK